MKTAANLSALGVYWQIAPACEAVFAMSLRRNDFESNVESAIVRRLREQQRGTAATKRIFTTAPRRH